MAACNGNGIFSQTDVNYIVYEMTKKTQIFLLHKMIVWVWNGNWNERKYVRFRFFFINSFWVDGKSILWIEYGIMDTKNIFSFVWEKF